MLLSSIDILIQELYDRKDNNKKIRIRKQKSYVFLSAKHDQNVTIVFSSVSPS